MEASLQISSPVKVAPASFRAAAPAMPAVASSVLMPMAFMITGLGSLLIAVAWLILSPTLLATYHYNQNIIALTHLFVLGWIGSVVMGATYQLVPVALETKLYSDRLARVQFAVHCVGFVGMVWMFHVWNLKQVGHFGSVFATGVGLFAFNIVQTLRRVPKWSVTATAVSAALAWICAAALAGLLIAAAKCLNGSESPSTSSGLLLHGLRSVAALVSRFDPIGAMHAHAHLGALGCFTMLLVGVSYKVIPMFTLSEVQSRRRAGASLLLLNLGLAGSFVSILLRSSAKVAFSLLTVAGLVVFLIELSAIVRRRKRHTLDWGLKSFLTAVSLVLPLAVLSLVLCWPGLPLTSLTGQLENLYGFLGFAGFISFAIIGMLYKILPFLVWFKSYSRQVGRAQVPSLSDMYSSAGQAMGYWSYVVGLLVTSVGIVRSSETFTRTGCAFLGLGLLTLLLNVGSMMRHLLQPRLKPLAASPSNTSKLA